MTATLCVPQWQGSGSDRARKLADGAAELADLVPAERRVTAPVSQLQGSPDSDVRRLGVLVDNLAVVQDALAGLDDTVITLGGDCGVELAPISAARTRYGDQLTVLWLDAHPDLNTPQSSPSGAFHGMVLRTLLGQGRRR
ncbi:MAG: arginase family protein [Micromonosporaceae bacterium]